MKGLLEHEAAVDAAQAGEVVLAAVGDVRAGQDHSAEAGVVEPRQRVEESGFAGARRAHDDGEGAGCDAQVEVAQDVLLETAVGEGPRQALGDDDGVRGTPGAALRTGAGGRGVRGRGGGADGVAGVAGAWRHGAPCRLANLDGSRPTIWPRWRRPACGILTIR